MAVGKPSRWASGGTLPSGMSALRRRRRAPPGASPGTLIADPAAQQTTVRVIAYGPDDIEEHDVTELGQLPVFLDRFPVTWVDVAGLSDVEAIGAIGDLFGLHGLALEDVVNVYQRPKYEDYDDYLYIVTRMAEPGRGLHTEQISIFLGPKFVVSFQERPGDCFNEVRTRLQTHRGRIRARPSEYLAYALLDAVIDAYFPVAEDYGERVESLEETVLEAPAPEVMADIHALKRDLMIFRRTLWSQREMVNALLRDPSPFIGDETALYLRDCYDHTVQLLDIAETYREIASGLVDLYLSSISNRMNEIMKVLTVMASIFIPLTFIAGIYGMNFSPGASPWNMPELTWYWGYPAALGAMAAIAAGLVYFFWRRRWIGRGQSTGRDRQTQQSSR